jgi:hypothetical protein
MLPDELDVGRGAIQRCEIRCSGVGRHAEILGDGAYEADRQMLPSELVALQRLAPFTICLRNLELMNWTRRFGNSNAACDGRLQMAKGREPHIRRTQVPHDVVTVATAVPPSERLLRRSKKLSDLGGAMGIRTPDLLHAIPRQHVHPRPSVQVTVPERPPATA